MIDFLVSQGLWLAGALFVLGLLGVIARRNLIFVLLSVEIMFNATALAFVVAGAKWNQPDGQIMYPFIVTVTAAEVAVGLALVLQIFARFKSLNTDTLNRLRG